MYSINLGDEQHAQVLIGKIACAFSEAAVIGLHGDLGMGKTTFVRQVLRSHGVTERIKSPTYSLLEQYEVGGVTFAHLDCYRLKTWEDLENIGFRDLIDEGCVIFVEWPQVLQHSGLVLDLIGYFSMTDLGGRQIDLESATDKGAKIISKIIEAESAE